MSVRRLPTGKWEARARVDGRHLKKVFARKTDATAWEAQTRTDRDRGAYVDMGNRITVAEYFARWYQMRTLRPGTLKNRRTMLANHLEGVPLGSLALVKVRPSDVQAWATSRAAVLAPLTLRNYCTALRSMFTTAVLDGVIVRNPVPPAVRMSLPKDDRPKYVPLTIPQVRAWANAADPGTAAMILTQAGLGLRISELLALRVTDVNFLRREVSITRQTDSHGKDAPLKTSRSRRVVPLPAVVADVLSARPPGPDGHLFTRPLRSLAYPGGTAQRPGRTWIASQAAIGYRHAAAAAGLPAGTTSHDLRHHYASVLLDAGESVHAVAERLGDTPAMVLQTYGHLMPNREETTRRAVDTAWRDPEIRSKSA